MDVVLRVEQLLHQGSYCSITLPPFYTDALPQLQSDSGPNFSHEKLRPVGPNGERSGPRNVPAHPIYQPRPSIWREACPVTGLHLVVVRKVAAICNA